MKKLFAFASTLLTLAAFIATPALASGFNQYGYNYGARIFNGTALNWCLASGAAKSACENSLGVYANDQLVMKWNAQWDNCNNNGYDNPTYCLGAWDDNEWNGKVSNGSGQNWHYKIIWVGSLAENSPYWQPGGYSVWGNYEVVMDQGTDPNVGPGHMWFAHAVPNGYGAVLAQ